MQFDTLHYIYAYRGSRGCNLKRCIKRLYLSHSPRRRVHVGCSCTFSLITTLGEPRPSSRRRHEKDALGDPALRKAPKLPSAAPSGCDEAGALRERLFRPGPRGATDAQCRRAGGHCGRRLLSVALRTRRACASVGYRAGGGPARGDGTKECRKRWRLGAP